MLSPFPPERRASAAIYAEAYYNPPRDHPSEANYLWMEGGTTFGHATDAPPAENRIASHAHLVRLLDEAGVSWRTYQEDIAGDVCPLTAVRDYLPRHNPFVFFDDLTGGGDPNDVRPFLGDATRANDLADLFRHR